MGAPSIELVFNRCLIQLGHGSVAFIRRGGEKASGATRVCSVGTVLGAVSQWSDSACSIAQLNSALSLSLSLRFHFAICCFPPIPSHPFSRRRSEQFVLCCLLDCRSSAMRSTLLLLLLAALAAALLVSPAIASSQGHALQPESEMMMEDDDPVIFAEVTEPDYEEWVPSMDDEPALIETATVDTEHGSETYFGTSLLEAQEAASQALEQEAEAETESEVDLDAALESLSESGAEGEHRKGRRRHARHSSRRRAAKRRTRSSRRRPSKRRPAKKVKKAVKDAKKSKSKPKSSTSKPAESKPTKEHTLPPAALPAIERLLNRAKSDEKFQKFKAKFGKKYASAEEEVKHFNTFQVNSAKVAALKELESSDGEEEPADFDLDGPFADVDEVEFATKYASARPEPPPAGSKVASFMELGSETDDASLMELSTNATAQAIRPFNWKRISTAIKNQGQCGSCWAHAVTEAVESARRKAGKALKKLSPQHLVDCQRVNAYGCNGGSLTDTFDFYKANRAFYNGAYPYRARQGRCKRKSGNAYRTHGYQFAVPWCPANTGCGKQDDYEGRLLRQLKRHGPIAIIVDSGSAWQHYRRGIMGPRSCSRSWAAMDHAVVLVGYGKTKTGRRYWIVRNSWGKAWGESGYIRLAYGKNTCGVANYALFPVL